jgi:hypothetical protein
MNWVGPATVVMGLVGVAAGAPALVGLAIAAGLVWLWVRS